jgi:CheY-like chemotaxis protein
MTHLLDDLLDVGRVTHGKIQVHKERLDLVALVRDTVEEQRSGAEASGLTLTASLPERPLWLFADPTRLCQSVANLLVNAIKFTPWGGQIAVSVAAEGGSAAVTVADDGAGMEPEMITRLFEPFSQADRSLDRSAGGLGLGLSLVRSFMELHGGTVEGHSEGPGRGSAFTLRLPLVDELPAPPPPPVASALPRRILVIEDHPDAAEAMQIMLKLEGHEVAVARDGEEGVELSRAFHPTVVICDIGLPGVLDGYQVASAMRADPELRGVHLIAFSGYGQADDKRRAAAAGFDDHLTKPVAPEVLGQIIAEGPRGAGPRAIER